MCNMALFLFAPRVGIEPTTKRLHVSPHFWEGWTISSSVLDARRFQLFRAVLPCGIVSEPSIWFLKKLGCWLPSSFSLRLPAIHLVLHSYIPIRSCVMLSCISEWQFAQSKTHLCNSACTFSILLSFLVWKDWSLSYLDRCDGKP